MILGLILGLIFADFGPIFGVILGGFGADFWGESGRFWGAGGQPLPDVAVRVLEGSRPKLSSSEATAR